MEYDMTHYDWLVGWLAQFPWDQLEHVLMELPEHKKHGRKLAKEGILRYLGEDDGCDKYELNI